MTSLLDLTRTLQRPALRTPRTLSDEHRQIGSLGWQYRREQSAHDRGKRYSPAREIAVAILLLEEFGVHAITAKGETATGRMLHYLVVFKMEADRALARLPARQRTCWVAARLNGERYADIAAGLQISEEAVRNAISLADARISDAILDKPVH